MRKPSREPTASRRWRLSGGVVVAGVAALSLALLASPALARPRPSQSAGARWQARHDARSAPASARSRALARSMPAAVGRPSAGASDPFGSPPAGSASSIGSELLAASGLSGTGAIAGTVRAVAGSAPVAEVEVCAFSFVEGLFGGCAETNFAGEYEIAGLAAGEYVVEFFPAGAPSLLTQFYDGAGRESEAQPVTVAEGAVTEQVDADLLQGGTLTGAIADAAGAPLAGIEICAESLTGPFEGRCATSGGDGSYEVLGLPSGEYAVEFSAPAELDYATEFYDGTPEGTADRTQAAPVAVSAPAGTPGIDAKLRVGASIEGTVTAAGSKAGLGGIVVCAFDPEALVGRCAGTEQDGSYVLRSLAGGEDEVSFTARLQRGLNYADQFYDGKARPEEATPLAVVEGSTTPGIDAALVAGGQLEGHVTSAASGLPLEEVSVCALPSDRGLGLRCESTDAQGRYDIVGLSSETYVVGFFGPEGEYQTQYYEEAPSEAGAKKLAIHAGKATHGIDAALKLRAPSALSIPRIAGRAVEGQTLVLTHASWSGRPTGYVDEWERCAGSGPTRSCETVGQGLGYTLLAADVGDTIVAREAAVNVGGESRFAYSAPTAIVVMAARESQPPPGGGAAPGGQPGQGVSGSTSSLPSLSQLGALLRHLLAPVGKGARIGALLRHGAYVLAFAALAPGRLTISWYLPSKGAHLATAKAVLVAVGHAGLAGVGAAKLKVGLTARGRGLLRHARRLKLTADGVLTTVGQRPVSASKGFTLVR